MSVDVMVAEPVAAPALPRSILWIMAAACGASAANIYYNQPLLGEFARYFHASPAHAGLVATAAQVGYGVGLFFFLPLGDLLERRKIILTLVGTCVVLLLATAMTPTLALLILCQLLVGMTAMSAQLLIPLAVDLTPIEERGRTVGTLMAGLLCGILLARVVSGFIGSSLGWRAMFVVAAVTMLVLWVVLRFTLPHRAPALKMPYLRLMHSMLELGKNQQLVTASLVSGLSFGAFTAFWTTLVFLMETAFHKGAAEAGMFGLVGVVGALAAPVAGKVSDKKGPRFTVTIAVVSTMLAFAMMWAWVSILSLILGVLLMDLGVQSIQVAKQAKVMALVPAARNRVNTFYMVSRFIGGAAGSALGASMWTWGGWPAVCGLALAMLGAGMGIHLIGTRGER